MRLAQWQNPISPSAEDHRPNLLFLAHCVPNPPDKGEKIRAFHEVRFLARTYRIHLVCFGRSDRELDAALELSGVCSSIYAERFSPARALAYAGVRFALGESLNQAYYRSAAMKEYVASLSRRVPLHATVAFTAVMMPYAPPGLPILLDMLDVDSEKWFQYAQVRRPGFLYRIEAGRLRHFEKECTAVSQCTLLTTQNEESLLRSFAPGACTGYFENGTDTDFFDGRPHPLPPERAGSRFVVFVGTMDYFPNSDGAQWFSKEIFSQLRRRDPELQFFIVGKNPDKEVRALARIDGVTVTGGVPDIRPYLSNARAIVVPLRLARGIQNKVLEGLAMGRPVFATAEVCQTFGENLPHGIVRCDSASELILRVGQACTAEPQFDPAIRQAVIDRFTWNTNLAVLERHLSGLSRVTIPTVVSSNES